ncbi:MAG: hypothetical protein EOQ69_29925, partial [Mesorhizobium sp.]
MNLASQSIGGDSNAVVILGRSKERSDAEQTLGSMPFHLRFATVRNSVRQRSTITATAWIPRSSRRRFAAASPWNDGWTAPCGIECAKLVVLKPQRRR